MEPGPLLASGRDGNIYEFGPGLVLRKTNDGRSIAEEARIMDYVAEQGFPVPAIHELRAGGSEIVMERVDGPMMLGGGLGATLRLPRMLGILADLHDQLHRIVAPDWLRSFGDGDRLLHLDLHPLNVIMSPTRGPVVIDWPNATRGDPMADVALTYVLLTCPRIPVPRPLEVALNSIRTPLVKRSFARRYRGRAFDDYVALMAELKCLDRNMAPDEIMRMQALAKRMRAPG
jgi:aminoglycoside phosphotransferase (APT) family kinase protein